MHTTRWQIAARQTQDELLAWDELDFTFLKVQNFLIILMLTTISITAKCVLRQSSNVNFKKEIPHILSA
jgi:hypothetical protein